MKTLSYGKATLIGLLIFGFWVSGCTQQEGPAEKAGKAIDQTVEEVRDSMEDTTEEVVDTAQDLAEQAKDITTKD